MISSNRTPEKFYHQINKLYTEIIHIDCSYVQCSGHSIFTIMNLTGVPMYESYLKIRYTARLISQKTLQSFPSSLTGFRPTFGYLNQFGVLLIFLAECPTILISHHIPCNLISLPDNMFINVNIV